MTKFRKYEILTTYAFNQFIPIFFVQVFAVLVAVLLKSFKGALLLGFNPADPMIKPTVEFWSGLPVMFLFTCWYIALANRFPREKLFYITVALLVVPLMVGTWWIYPIRGQFMPSGQGIQHLRESLPQLQMVFVFYGRWIEVLMMAWSALWGPVMVSLCVWQFANDITNLIKARFFYPVLAFLSGVPYLFGDMLVQKIMPQSLTAQTAASYTQLLMVFVGGFALAMCYVYRRYHHLHEKNSAYLPEQKPLNVPLISSLNATFSEPLSRMLVFLTATLAFVAHVFVDIFLAQLRTVAVEKETLSQLNRQMEGWMGPMGKLTILYIVIALLQLRKNKWTGLSWMTSLTLVAMGTGLYIVTYTGYLMTDTKVWDIPMGLLSIIVVLTVLESIRQYWFMPMKEMTFLTMPAEHRVKSKAVCDILGVCLGVSAAQMFLWFMRVWGDFMQTIPYIMGFAMVLCLVWMRGAMSMHAYMRKTEALLSQKRE